VNVRVRSHEGPFLGGSFFHQKVKVDKCNKRHLNAASALEIFGFFAFGASQRKEPKDFHAEAAFGCLLLHWYRSWVHVPAVSEAQARLRLDTSVMGLNPTKVSRSVTPFASVPWARTRGWARLRQRLGKS